MVAKVTIIDHINRISPEHPRLSGNCKLPDVPSRIANSAQRRVHPNSAVERQLYCRSKYCRICNPAIDS
jgi:hypothetical protein